MKTKQWKYFSMERIHIALWRYYAGVIACAKHILISPFVRPEKANQFLCGALALNDHISYKSSTIPEKTLETIFPTLCGGDFHVGRVFPRDGSNISPLETLCLAAIVKHLAPRIAFEIGTSMGVTSFNIALNLPQDGKLFTLDLPPVALSEDNIETKYKVSVSDRKMIFSNRRKRRFENSHVTDAITQLYGDSAVFDYTPYIKQCDFIFIDGSHAYQYVKCDTENALRMAKSGATILWHDYTDGHMWPGVAAYLQEISQKVSICRIRGTTLAIGKIH